MITTPSLLKNVSFVYMFTEPGEHDLTNYHALHPQERALVSHAVEVRQAEFGDTRWCAHRALHDLGLPGILADQPILRGEQGMPLWPAGYTGSLTHTDGLRAAIAAHSSDWRSLGLDVEPADPLPDDVLGSIARRGEFAQLKRLGDKGLTCPDRLLFCAKEATYKAWFPMTKRWLGFEDAEIILRDDGTFISYLLVRPTPVPYIEGQWLVHDGYIIAITHVPPGIGEPLER